MLDPRPPEHLVHRVRRHDGEDVDRRRCEDVGGDTRPRRAVLVEPETPAVPGTILYFHGGSFMLGCGARRRVRR